MFSSVEKVYVLSEGTKYPDYWPKVKCYTNYNIFSLFLNAVLCHIKVNKQWITSKNHMDIFSEKDVHVGKNVRL